MYFLYVKTHNKTGLKYLGQTSKDPAKYKGSGKYWLRHLKKHGNDCATTILGSYVKHEDLKVAGIYYSSLWNVAKSEEWANLVEESGKGGGEQARLGGKKRATMPNWSESELQKRKGSSGGKKSRSRKVGIFARSLEEMQEHARKIGTGTFWATNGLVNKRVRGEIPAGFRRGMTR